MTSQKKKAEKMGESIWHMHVFKYFAKCSQCNLILLVSPQKQHMNRENGEKIIWKTRCLVEGIQLTLILVWFCSLWQTLRTKDRAYTEWLIELQNCFDFAISVSVGNRANWSRIFRCSAYAINLNICVCL